MKRFQFKTGLIFASWALMLIFGCHKKKPPLPPQEQPPTIAAQPPVQPEQKPEETQPQTPPPVQEPPPPTKPPEKPATKHTRSHPVHKSEPEKPVEVAKNTPPEPPSPPRVVIQEGGSNSSSGQVGNGSNDDSTHNQATTQQLLDSTETNLHSIKRQLSSNEQSIVAQIRDYITQSKQATKDGDTVRAYKLAFKAHLLSDDLAKSK